jgi:hypothetical protein
MTLDGFDMPLQAAETLATQPVLERCNGVERKLVSFLCKLRQFMPLNAPGVQMSEGKLQLEILRLRVQGIACPLVVAGDCQDYILQVVFAELGRS